MELQSINPFIRYCDIYPQPILYPEMMMAYDCRIFYVLYGEGNFYINDNVYSFQENSVVYIPSGTKYRFTYDKNSKIVFLILNFDFTSDYRHITESFATDTCNHFNRNRMIQVPDNSQLTKNIYIYNFSDGEKDLMTIQSLFFNKPHLYSEQASGLFKKVFLQLLSFQYNETKSPSARLAEQVLSYIKNHYSEPLTNQMIADEFGFHPYYLNRIFKEEYSQNMHNYLINHRIKEAKNLLSTSTYSIQNIAHMVGFGTPSQFSVAFKKITGSSPAQYREKSILYL